MNHRIQDLVIPNAGSESNILSESVLQGIQSLLIYGPAVLAEVVNIQVSADGGTTWSILRSGATDMALAAGKADPVNGVAFQQLRLKSTTNVAAARTFQVSAQELES